MNENTKIISFSLSMNDDLDIEFLYQLKRLENLLSKCHTPMTRSKLLKTIIVTDDMVAMLKALCDEGGAVYDKQKQNL